MGRHLVRRRFAWVLVAVLGALLVPGAARSQSQSQSESESGIVSTASLAEVRTKLLGTPGAEPGLFGAGKPFVIEFQGLVMTAADSAGILVLAREAKALAPRSAVTMGGTMDGEPFWAKFQRGKSGQLEIEVKGLKPEGHAPVLELLGALSEQVLDQVKIRYTVRGWPYEAKLEGNP